MKLKLAVDNYKRNNNLRNELSIASDLEIHPNRWNQIKNGNLIPNKEEIQKISKFFWIGAVELFGKNICKDRGIL